MSTHVERSRRILFVHSLLFVWMIANQPWYVPPARGGEAQLGDDGGHCSQLRAEFLDEVQGTGCRTSLRPETTEGTPAPFVITARSAVDHESPTDPNAPGEASSVHLHTHGLGAKPNDCSGVSGLSGSGWQSDEELIFVLDDPVAASALVVGLNRIEFDDDTPVIFLSSAGSEQFDYTILEPEIEEAFRDDDDDDDDRGEVRFAMIRSLPADLYVDAFKVRETQSRIYVHFVALLDVCDDGNPCTMDACDHGACAFWPAPNGTDCSDGVLCNGSEKCEQGVCVGGGPACDDGDACTVDSCDAQGDCRNQPDTEPCDDGTSYCDDCNRNGVRDACDISSGVSDDANDDGIPDECGLFDGDCGENNPNWSCAANWNLGNVYPDNNASATYAVTLDGIDQVFLDLTVDIDLLRLLDNAVLRVTQTGPAGDLIIVGDAGLLNEGTILTAGNRVIDLTCGPAMIRDGSYRRDPSAPPGSVQSLLNCETLTIAAGGVVSLEDSMAIQTSGDVVLDGTGTAPCTQDGGKSPPILGSKSTSRLDIQGSLTILGPAGFVNESVSTVRIGGDFDNRNNTPDCFDSSIGRIVMQGVDPQTFEVAGEDFGASDTGFNHPAGHTNYSVGQLEITGGGPVHATTFRNAQLNTAGAGGCAEALYVHSLTLRAGSSILLDNCRVYYESLIDEGATISTSGCGELLSLTTPCIAAQCHDGSVCTYEACVNQVCVSQAVTYGNVNGTGPANPDIDDILCLQAGFGNLSACPNGDITPCPGGDGIINLDDVLSLLSAFAGANRCDCSP